MHHSYWIFCTLILFSSFIDPFECKAPNALNFMWVTDIHFDPFYDGTINSTHYCRKDKWLSALGVHFKDAQQKWSSESAARFLSVQENAMYGRYGCDAPETLLLTAVEQMKKENPNPKFIVISGDFASHHLPSAQSALDTIAHVTNQFTNAYKEGSKSFIIPCIGNNDLFPDYFLPFDNTTWFERLYSIWSPVIPEQHQRESFLTGGYFYTDVLDDLRVIVLNSLYYSVKRWPQSTTNPEDPAGQFKWLTTQLFNSKQSGKNVIIVTHIPASQNAYDMKPLWVPQYLSTYLAIIAQFPDIIVTQLYGHLHTDEFRVQTSPDGYNRGPIAFGMIGSSISPVFENNAAFREFSLDQLSDGGYRIQGYKQYYLDIYASNQASKPIWTFQYDYNQAYNQNGMDSKSVASLLESLTQNNVLFSDYISRRSTLYTPDRYKYYCEISALNQHAFNNCLASGSNDGV